MELQAITDALSQPEAYPHPVDTVEVIQTHASVVFLAGEYAYKIKKPVDFGFLDYSTFARRRNYCFFEVELNRRLSRGVYLGVVGIGWLENRLQVGVELGPVEHAVKMRRLDPDARWASRVPRGLVSEHEVDRVAQRIAEFHRSAGAGPDVARYARYDAVAKNCLDNLRALEPRVGTLLERELFDHLSTATTTELERRRDLIEARAEAGVPRDTHGDLRLEHVYIFEGAAPPNDIQVVDCIEFNRAFRFADPIADAAFLAMDLRANGANSLADRFVDAYIEASGDEEGRVLFPLYESYRAAVRAKVDALRTESTERAKAKVLLADRLLQRPKDRACLVLTAGLPGTGKSVMARGLVEARGFEWLRMDVIRKELAGLRPGESGGDAPGQGIYTREWSDRTYACALERSLQLLAAGRPVLVDGTFKEDARRRRFIEAARQLGVPVHVLICETSADVARHRLENRTEDPSDADWAVYRVAVESWERPTPFTEPACVCIDTTPDPPTVVHNALQALAQRGCGREAPDARGLSPAA